MYGEVLKFQEIEETTIILKVEKEGKQIEEETILRIMKVKSIYGDPMIISYNQE